MNTITQRRWAQRAAQAETLPLDRLRRLRRQARSLRAALDKFFQTADRRLALPLLGSNAMQLPPFTEWAERPVLWRGPVTPSGMAGVESGVSLGRDVELFHDSAAHDVSYRQIRNTNEHDLAPFGLSLETYNFDGTFLSVSVSLADEGRAGLGKRHVLRLDVTLSSEAPAVPAIRLNIKSGPNQEQIKEPLRIEGREGYVEFDLTYAQFNEKRVDAVWIDIIFETPAMNRIVISDITLSRRPRAEF